MREKEVQEHAIKKLESEGWTFWFPPRTWDRRDIFGVFDFCAFRKNIFSLVQLTTLQHISDREKKIRKWAQPLGIILRHAEVWAWDKKKGRFIIRKINNGLQGMGLEKKSRDKGEINSEVK